MFKSSVATEITAEEIKNRILAYAALEAAQEKPAANIWYGNIATYTLNLRLSGIFQEKPCSDVLTHPNTEVNLGKYVYLDNEVFLRETTNLDHVTFVKQMYLAFLRREADPGGLAGNVEQLSHGVPRENLVIGIRNSGEADGVFMRVTDCLNDETFVEIAHRVYLNPIYQQFRKLTDLEALQQGQSRQAVFEGIKKFQRLQTILENLAQDFYQDEQTFIENHQHLDDEAFVEQLYRTFLKREADPGGKQSHVEQLQQGISRQEILFALRTSEEAAGVFVNLTADLDDETFLEVAYQAYLKQELEPQAQKLYLQTLTQGRSRQEILNLIL
jgi:hypothetical protein